MEAQTSLVLWRYERWRCVYHPVSDTLGRLVVYSDDEPVLEIVNVISEDAQPRATGLRVLTQLATNRLSGTAKAAAQA